MTEKKDAYAYDAYLRTLLNNSRNEGEAKQPWIRKDGSKTLMRRPSWQQLVQMATYSQQPVGDTIRQTLWKNSQLNLGKTIKWIWS